MPENIEVTNNKPRSIVVWQSVFNDATMNSTGAAVFAAGTVLGKLTANGKFTAWDSGASDGAEIPVAVLSVEEEFIGSGDRAIRPLVGGQVRAIDLIEHGVGAVSAENADLLRDFGIIAQASVTLTEQDNQ